MTQPALPYRREIDGLRGIAVLPVTLFHAQIGAFSGGYVGVDVFFVISGYLITAILLNEMKDGRLNLLAFYERRARRILPALFLVMLACLPFAWVLMPAAALKEFGESLAAMAGFASNILFFFRSGYFAREDGEVPLLHTWTLSVEEQFYLLFPLLLLACRRFGGNRMAWVIGTVAGISFLFAHLCGNILTHYPYWATNWALVASRVGFFLTPARAWELMAGALIAACPPPAKFSNPWLQEAGAALGLAAILCAVFVFDAATPAPSFYTLLPVIGACLIILCARPNTMMGRILGHPWLVGLGLISYSFYLWHQPVLAFARLYAQLPLDTATSLALVAVAACLALLSWRFLETPFRDRDRVSGKQVLMLAVGGTLFFLVTGATLLWSHGAVARFTPADRLIAAIDIADARNYVHARADQMQTQFDNRPGRKVLVVGDSFGQDLVNMIAEAGALHRAQLRFVYVPAECQLVLPSPDTAYCRQWALDRPAARQSIAAADIVLIAGFWRPATAIALPMTLARAGLRADQNVYVLGAKSFGVIRPMDYIRVPPNQRSAIRNAVPALPSNHLLRARFGAQFIDDQAVACGGDGSCPVITADGKLVSFDGVHLTRAGARQVGTALFRGPLRTLAGG